MRCIRLTSFTSSNGFYVNCGQCMPCRINRRVEWVSRCILEFNTFPKSVFVTLTYAPENLPDSDKYQGGNLSKDDFQKFLKRFRKNYTFAYGDNKLRYFGVGEYGDKSQRAHYHFLLFNVEPSHAENMVRKSWTLGHSRTDLLNVARISYTAQYTIKKMTSVKDFKDGRNPEFMLSSKMPAIGWYAIPKLAELCRKYGLCPAANTLEENWILENEGYEPKIWYGNFFFDKDLNIEFPVSEDYKPSPGATYAQLDTAMMSKLHRYMYPLTQTYLDARKELLTPKAFKVRRYRLTDHSYIGKIKFEESVDYEKETKKSEKIKFQSKQQKTI